MPNLAINPLVHFDIEKKDYVEKFKSIIFKDLIDFAESSDDLVIDTFPKDIDFSNKKLKTLNEEIVFLIKEDNEIYFNSEIELYNIQNNYYFMF